MAEDVDWFVHCLPGVHKALGLIPRTSTWLVKTKEPEVQDDFWLHSKYKTNQYIPDTAPIYTYVYVGNCGQNWGMLRERKMVILQEGNF